MPAKTDLTKGDERTHLIQQSIPMAWGVLASTCMVLTDTYFIGWLGTDALAAVGFTIPVVLVLFGIGWGFGTAVSSIVGRAIGTGDDSLVRDLTTQSILLAMVVALGFTVAGYASADRVFGLLGAPKAMVPLIRDYMDIWFLGAFAVVVPQVGNAAIRAAGNARTPGQVMIAVAGLNVVLDPIFMFGWFGFPRLELQGAALASVVAFAVSFTASFYMLRVRLNFVRLDAINASMLHNWRRVTLLALPAIGNNLVFPASAAVTTWLIAGFGTAAVAGFNVAVRIEALTMVPVTALTFAMASFAGQNYGAGRIDRLEAALIQSYRFAWILGGAVIGVSLLAAWVLVPGFTDDPMALRTARLALIIVPLSYPMLYILMIISAAGNGIGHTTPALVMSLARMLVFFVPLAWMLAQWVGLAGVFVAMLLCNIVTGIGARRYITRRIAALRASPAHAPI